MSYEYEVRTIRYAEANIRSRLFRNAYELYLTEHNHGHSGWTGKLPEIFENPKTEYERGLKTRLMAIHKKVAEGLLSLFVPSDDLMETMDLSAVWICLERLGSEAPAELRNKLDLMLEECIKLGAKPKWFGVMRR